MNKAVFFTWATGEHKRGQWVWLQLADDIFITPAGVIVTTTSDGEKITDIRSSLEVKGMGELLRRLDELLTPSIAPSAEEIALAGVADALQDIAEKMDSIIAKIEKPKPVIVKPVVKADKSLFGRIKTRIGL